MLALEQYIVDEDASTFRPRGLHLVSPLRTGLRVVRTRVHLVPYRLTILYSSRFSACRDFICLLCQPQTAMLYLLSANARSILARSAASSSDRLASIASASLVLASASSYIRSTCPSANVASGTTCTRVYDKHACTYHVPTSWSCGGRPSLSKGRPSWVWMVCSFSAST